MREDSNMIAELAAANAAYDVIKQTIANGQEIYQAAEAMAQYFGLKNEIQQKAHEHGYKSDLEAFMAAEQLKAQEEELKQMMIYQGRGGMWNDWLQYQAEMKRSREEAKAEELRNRHKRKRMLIDGSIIGATVVGLLAIIITFFVAISAHAEPIVTESTTNSTITSSGSMDTTVKSPPPSAISPQFSGGSNSDLCTVGVAGAVQTQILGVSTGTQVTDENCERLKNAKTLYDMGMKVAAVSVMCQDSRVFEAMMNAGTPCPFDGKIGSEAKAAWETNSELMPEKDKKGFGNGAKTLLGGAGVASLLILLLL
mgnify:CR=1 FL=1